MSGSTGHSTCWSPPFKGARGDSETDKPPAITAPIPGARPSHHFRVSRRIIRSPRPAHFPSPRPPHPYHRPMMESTPRTQLQTCNRYAVGEKSMHRPAKRNLRPARAGRNGIRSTARTQLALYRPNGTSFSPGLEKIISIIRKNCIFAVYYKVRKRKNAK